jgi:hypothetical protein
VPIIVPFAAFEGACRSRPSGCAQLVEHHVGGLHAEDDRLRLVGVQILGHVADLNRPVKTWSSLKKSVSNEQGSGAALDELERRYERLSWLK